MRRALAYVLGAVRNPRQAYTLIVFDAGGFVTSLSCLFGVAVSWAVAALGLALAGFEPWTPLWLAIPGSEYYFWQALFSIPVTLAAWLLVSGFVQIASQRSGGSGSFEATAKLLALSIAVSRLVVLIPALVLVILALTGAVDAAGWLNTVRGGSHLSLFIWILMLIEATWMARLVSVAVRASHKLRVRPSMRVAIPAVLLFYAFSLIFFR